MKKFIAIFFLLFLLSILQAQDISTLLQRLDDTKALYHKTKVESAGLVMVYSRFDLDRMQAYTLKDVLKSLRFFTYKEGYVGEPALSPSGGNSVVSSMFRLYIDNYEVSSAIYGSSMLQFAQMDLGFVDHIEIYEGGNAISFGNEPGLVTIRVYSKEAKRENGTSIATLADSRGTKEAKACYTKVIDAKSSLLAYFSGESIKREHVYQNSSDFSKDSKGQTFYLKYDFNDKDHIALGRFNQNRDAFVGVGMKHTPLKPNEIDRLSSFLNFSLSLPLSFKLNISFDKTSHRMLFSDKNRIFIVQNPKPFVYFDGEFSETVYKLELKNSFEHKNGNFKWGLQEIQKSYSIDHMLMGGNAFTNPSGPSRLNITSVYGEESYNIDENNLLIATLKMDNYHDNYNSNNSIETIARLGYIHLFTPNFVFKTFLSKSYLYPGFAYTSSFPNIYLNNPDLKAEHYSFAIAELKYDMLKSSFKLNALYIQNSDPILFDHISKKFINGDDNFDTFRFSVGYTYRFDLQNKIEAGFYSTHFFDDVAEKSPTSGASFKILNSIGKFDIFNEIIYRNSYTYPLPAVLGGPIKIKKGFDYNAGVKWHINHAFTASFKGENILGKASKTPIFGLGGTDASDRRFMVQMEYFF